MTTYDDIICEWSPSQCAYMALCDYPTALGWAKFNEEVGHEPYPKEVSRT